MDIQAYLARIGYTGTAEPTKENLSRIIRCHLETVPFENLDSCPNCYPLSNDPEVLFDKVVNHRRGGVCFELNGLFYELLKALGYDCYPVEARLRNGILSHEGILVTFDGVQYYCDVGCGGPVPKDLMRMDTEDEQLIYGNRFRMRRDGLQTHIQRLSESGWGNMVSFVNSPCIPGDFTARLYYYGMYPNSPFVTIRKVNICLPCGGYVSIENSRMTTCRNGVITQQELETEEAFHQALKTEFGLNL